MNISRQNLKPSNKQTFFPESSGMNFGGNDRVQEAKQINKPITDAFQEQDNTLWDKDPTPGSIALSDFKGPDGSSHTGQMKADGTINAISERGDYGEARYTSVSRDDDGSMNYFSYDDPGALERLSAYNLVTEHSDGNVTVETGRVQPGFYEDVSGWDLGQTTVSVSQDEGAKSTSFDFNKDPYGWDPSHFTGNGEPLPSASPREIRNNRWFWAP